MVYEPHDYSSRELTREELDDMLMGMPAKSLVNPRSPTFRRLGITYGDLTDTQAVGIMLEHNVVIHRPVVRYRGERIVGHDTQAYEGLAREQRAEP